MGAPGALRLGVARGAAGRRDARPADALRHAAGVAGQPANGFYLIQNGSVAIEGSVFEHGAISTDSVSAGEPLGWSWLFPPYLWHYDARAIKPTTAFFLDGAILHQACNEDLTLGHELFKRMSEVMVRRLQASRAKLIEALKPAGHG